MFHRPHEAKNSRMLDQPTQLNASLSILVVDDNRFSSAMIKRALKGTPYQDIRYTSSAQETLGAINDRPVDILIADWLMPEMDGLELAEKVRAIDLESDRFTYIILITAKDGNSALNEAFDKGVDDFINKDQMNEQLLPRIRAADRVTQLYSGLLKKHDSLKKKLQALEKNNAIDALTGLGNKRYALQKIKETIRYCQHRDGVIQLVMIEIHPWEPIKKQYPPAILQGLIRSVGMKLHAISRPLDILCRIDTNQFILITHHKNLEECKHRSFRRFKDDLTGVRIKTPVGSVSIDVAMAICAAEVTRHQASSAELLINHCLKTLEKAKLSGRIEAASSLVPIQNSDSASDPKPASSPPPQANANFSQ